MPTLPEGLVLIGDTTAPRGRGLAATRDFQPGQRIATFNSPSIAIASSPQIGMTCSGCLLVSKPPELGPPEEKLLSGRVARACTGCRTVAYCSTECQKLDWTTGGHKAECKIFKRVRDEGHDALPTPVRALLQVYLRPGIKASMAELQSHIEVQRSIESWRDMELQIMAALHYLGREDTNENMSEGLRILLKLQVNAFSRLDEDVGQSGLYMNPALAMVNHSCMPNAFVQFVGRKAVLHAYQEIKKDEEIQISYIDCNQHLAQRQEDLMERYYFTCTCSRCKDDMDVYQVCRAYPHLIMNRFSVAPHIQNLQESDPPGILSGNKSLSATIKEILPWCSGPLEEKLSGADKKKELSRRWQACKPLRDSSPPAYAIDPFPRTLSEAGIYFGQQGNYIYGLVIACFLATRVDPYRAAAPFAPQRVKGLWMIVKLTALAAPGQREIPPGLRGDIYEFLSTKVDHPLMCQIILELIVYYAPAAHSSQWAVFNEAKNMLADLEAVPTREEERKFVKLFMQDPNGVGERDFFENAVIHPLRELADFCLEVMDEEFGVQST
ncbi:SET domain-containing protein [Nemania abortiva]|nr:SET domain-containing protein [Nemania abortiva]